MAEVSLLIGGRSYLVACRDGEEPHLRTLAARVDGKASEARAAVGDTSEARLLLLSALLLADELAEAQEQHRSHHPSPEPSSDDATSILEAIAGRLEALADRLER